MGGRTTQYRDAKEMNRLLVSMVGMGLDLTSQTYTAERHASVHQVNTTTTGCAVAVHQASIMEWLAPTPALTVVHVLLHNIEVDVVFLIQVHALAVQDAQEVRHLPGAQAMGHGTIVYARTALLDMLMQAVTQSPVHCVMLENMLVLLHVSPVELGHTAALVLFRVPFVDQASTERPLEEQVSLFAFHA